MHVYNALYAQDFELPVDPSIRKRPIRFKLSVRTGNPLLLVSQNLPCRQTADFRLGRIRFQDTCESAFKGYFSVTGF